MDENEILSRAVEAITESASTLEVELPDSLSSVDRLLIRLHLRDAPKTRRVFKLKPLYVGNMYRIGARSKRIPPDFLQKCVANGGANISSMLIQGSADFLPDIIYIVGVGIQNNAEEPRPRLLRFIRDKFTMAKIFEACDKILSQADYQAFINTTVLIKGADVLSAAEPDATNAPEPEQKQPEEAGLETREIIARGE